MPMNKIEKICYTIAKEFSPADSMVVYMALSEYEPTELEQSLYGAFACKRLKDMQQELGAEDD